MEGMQAAMDGMWGAWLKAVDETFEPLTKSPEWVRATMRWFEGMVGSRTAWNELLEKTLTEARLASKDDVDRIVAEVRAVEARLSSLGERLDALQAVPAPRKAK
jgi:hypothetical protein